MLILDAGGLQIRQSCATEKGTALQMLILDTGGLQIRQSWTKNVSCQNLDNIYL